MPISFLSFQYSLHLDPCSPLPCSALEVKDKQGKGAETATQETGSKGRLWWAARQWEVALQSILTCLATAKNNLERKDVPITALDSYLLCPFPMLTRKSVCSVSICLYIHMHACDEFIHSCLWFKCPAIESNFRKGLIYCILDLCTHHAKLYFPQLSVFRKCSSLLICA